jgi:NAD(P)H-flavin reductase
MESFFITLVDKKQLTHDVFELVYTCDEEKSIVPGQFLVCETDTTNPRLRRSYSISNYSWWFFHCVIKQLLDGKWWSHAICSQKIGHHMQVWWPIGAFILPTITQEKLIFIGTGTGFAPLYFQAKHTLETSPDTAIHFIFGVREEKDLFYQALFQEWSEKYPHFSYQFCLSQWTGEGYFPGRVTKYLEDHADLIASNTIYSICGSPSMVKEVREILTAWDIQKEQIFFEQY